MLRIKMIAALLACCTTIGRAQNSADSQSQVQPPRPLRVRVSGGVMLGLVEHKAMPVYPDEARTAEIEGTVTVEAIIDCSGKVSSARVLNDHMEYARRGRPSACSCEC